MTETTGKQETAPKAAAARPRALVLTAHDPASDPRIGWVAGTLAARFDVIEIGLYRDQSFTRAPTLEDRGPGHRRVRLPATRWPAFIPEVAKQRYGENPGWSMLAGFAYETAGSNPALSSSKIWEAPDRAIHDRHQQLRRILQTNASIVRAARALGPAEVVVATDVDAMVAGVLLKHEQGSLLIYDAHEFWPYSFPQFRSADEEQAWVRIERLLAVEANTRFVVSPGLAEAMAETYGLPFEILPNATPLAEAATLPVKQHKSDDRIRFLFMGGFAPGRGIQHLINAWGQTPDRCVLELQGHDSPYKRQMISASRATGLHGSRIFFPPPVPEITLVERAAQADVGLVPYEPTLINHMHCSPNKLSQYMAAGLPILANRTRFVEQTIQKADCGLIIDFSDSQAIADAVAKLAHDEEMRGRLGVNARKGFETFFHWEAFSPALLAATEEFAALSTASPQDALAVLRGEFSTQAHSREATPQSALSRFGRSALRFTMKAVWHGVPFLRLIMLNNPRWRQHAEELRDL